MWCVVTHIIDFNLRFTKYLPILKYFYAKQAYLPHMHYTHIVEFKRSNLWTWLHWTRKNVVAAGQSTNMLKQTNKQKHQLNNLIMMPVKFLTNISSGCWCWRWWFSSTQCSIANHKCFSRSEYTSVSMHIDNAIKYYKYVTPFPIVIEMNKSTHSEMVNFNQLFHRFGHCSFIFSSYLEHWAHSDAFDWNSK